jgi:hypothetical protein
LQSSPGPSLTPDAGNAPQHAGVVRAELRTPRAAAIAGIVFSVLLIISLWLLRLAVPQDPHEVGNWLAGSVERVSVALALIPFAGIAFIWFLGVLRDRLGEREDQFFATVFLGSGIIFLVMLFVAAAAGGGLVTAYAVAPEQIFRGGAFAFGRAFAFDLMHIYAFKMAAVFMATSSTLAFRTGFTPRWIALVGFATALFLLIGSGYVEWAVFTFPGWIFLVSAYILFDNLRRSSPPRE